MVEITQGNLFDADVEAFVNPVHCAGIMKRGLCRQFKARFPKNTTQYKAACDNGTLRPGTVLVHDRGGLFGNHDRPRYILNVATKDHWRDAARLPSIEAGVDAITDEVRSRNIASIAVPALGCGGGGLDWPHVRPILTESLGTLDDTVQVLLYAPRSASLGRSRNGPGNRPALTRGRAVLLAVFDAYTDSDRALSPHAAHNLAYLLQCAGEDLQLQFEPGRYGLRASGLTAVLQHINGHFVEGYDANHQGASFQLRPSAVAEANDTVAAASGATDRLDRVRTLIDPVASDEDLELIVTTLWIMRHNPKPRRRPEAAVRAVHDWSRRKTRFAADHITATWKRLRDEHWGT